MRTLYLRHKIFNCVKDFLKGERENPMSGEGRGIHRKREFDCRIRIKIKPIFLSSLVMY